MNCPFSLKSVKFRETAHIAFEDEYVTAYQSTDIVPKIYKSVNTLSTASADVTVDGDVGSVRTMSGDVRCNTIQGSVNTMSGDVTCAQIEGGCSTMSGSIRR